MRTLNTRFYLVQRLESKQQPFPRDTGFDAYFSLEYMGSSEFEWGAIPKALKEIRTRPVVVEPATFNYEGTAYTIYFVGHKGVSAAVSDMEAWATGTDRRPHFWGKEWTHFDEVLTGTASDYVRTDAWWEIDSDVGWAIDPKVAQNLADAFNGKPRP